MRKDVPLALVVAAIVFVVALAVVFVVRAGNGGPGAAEQDKGRIAQVATKALMRTGGDTSKMTPEEKEAYETAMKHGLIQNPGMMPPAGPSGASGPMAGYGSAPMPGAGR